MYLTLREIADLFQVSEKTIYRWIKDKKLPVYRIGDQYRFHKAQVIEWATAQGMNIPPLYLLQQSSQETVSHLSLAEALERGGIFYRVEGNDKSSVLKSVVKLIPLYEGIDKEFLFQVLLARESLGSTAIGNGIAIPHPRNPIISHIDHPLITLCFLENPIDFGALDGEPVVALFTLISPTTTSHLQMLSRLAFALRQPNFFEVISQQRNRSAVLAEARSVDSQLFQTKESRSKSA